MRLVEVIHLAVCIPQPVDGAGTARAKGQAVLALQDIARLMKAAAGPPVGVCHIHNARLLNQRRLSRRLGEYTVLVDAIHEPPGVVANIVRTAAKQQRVRLFARQAFILPHRDQLGVSLLADKIRHFPNPAIHHLHGKQVVIKGRKAVDRLRIGGVVVKAALLGQRGRLKIRAGIRAHIPALLQPFGCAMYPAQVSPPGRQLKGIAVGAGGPQPLRVADRWLVDQIPGHQPAVLRPVQKSGDVALLRAQAVGVQVTVDALPLLRGKGKKAKHQRHVMPAGGVDHGLEGAHDALVRVPVDKHHLAVSRPYPGAHHIDARALHLREILVPAAGVGQEEELAVQVRLHISHAHHRQRLPVLEEVIPAAANRAGAGQQTGIIAPKALAVPPGRLALHGERRLYMVKARLHGKGQNQLLIADLRLQPQRLFLSPERPAVLLHRQAEPGIPRAPQAFIGQLQRGGLLRVIERVAGLRVETDGAGGAQIRQPPEDLRAAVAPEGFGRILVDQDMAGARHRAAEAFDHLHTGGYRGPVRPDSLD